jgi:hypothetical protein
MEYLIAYGIHLGAELTFVLLVIGGGYALARTGRRRLLRFFGVLGTNRLSIYFSLLRIPPFGALGTDDRPRSFGGAAIAWNEVELLTSYSQLFNYLIPGLQEQPGSYWRSILLSDVSLSASPSPLNPGEIDKSSTFICFGSPAYNGVSKWVEEDLHPFSRFIKDNSAIEVTGVPPFSDPLHGFVQRYRIGDGPAKAFYVAGPSAQATNASAYYLAAHWKDLQRRFGDRENFCVILRAEADDFRKCHILVERREQS